MQSRAPRTPKETGFTPPSQTRIMSPASPSSGSPPLLTLPGARQFLPRSLHRVDEVLEGRFEILVLGRVDVERPRLYCSSAYIALKRGAGSASAFAPSFPPLAGALENSFISAVNSGELRRLGGRSSRRIFAGSEIRSNATWFGSTASGRP
jgi:hypothetical protein